MWKIDEHMVWRGVDKGEENLTTELKESNWSSKETQHQARIDP